MREGDIYKWRWKDDKKHKDCGPFRSYHCKSRIAVFEDGYLLDTFWSGTSDGRLNPDNITATFVANKDELTEICAGNEVDYNHEDIVDMRHPNNTRGTVYLRNGAKKDAIVILRLITAKEFELEASIKNDKQTLERLAEYRKQIKSGNLEHIYF